MIKKNWHEEKSDLLDDAIQDIDDHTLSPKNLDDALKKKKL